MISVCQVPGRCARRPAGAGAAALARMRSPPPGPVPMSCTLGTPLTPGATRVMLLGSGELGKEVAIELQRLGVEVIAVDRYDHAPAMQVAHRRHTVDMLDADALAAVIRAEQPHVVLPEVEAIATHVLA